PERHRRRRLYSGDGQRPPAAVRSKRRSAQRHHATQRPAASAESRAGPGRRRVSSETSGARSSIRRHVVVGSIVVAVLAVGLGGWASTAEISGALIAPGSVVVDSNVKKVQHPTGGVVGEVRARDGDHVKAGDIVVRLDDTVTKANLAIVTKNLDAAQARASRLQAEQRGLTKLEFPQALLE